MQKLAKFYDAIILNLKCVFRETYRNKDFVSDHLTLKLIWLIATQCVPMLHLHVALFNPPPEKKNHPYIWPAIILLCNTMFSLSSLALE